MPAPRRRHSVCTLSAGCGAEPRPLHLLNGRPQGAGRAASRWLRGGDAQLAAGCRRRAMSKWRRRPGKAPAAACRAAPGRLEELRWSLGKPHEPRQPRRSPSSALLQAAGGWAQNGWLEGGKGRDGKARSRARACSSRRADGVRWRDGRRMGSQGSPRLPERDVPSSRLALLSLLYAARRPCTR